MTVIGDHQAGKQFNCIHEPLNTPVSLPEQQQRIADAYLCIHVSVRPVFDPRITFFKCTDASDNLMSATRTFLFPDFRSNK
jgi:hypothetical protein